MSKNKQHSSFIPQKPIAQQPAITSLLDKMEDGKEFESLLKYKAVNINIAGEIKKSLAEISAIRGKPVLCYLANVVNVNIKAPTSIDSNDDLPFSEMISCVPADVKEVDIIIVTPGGSGQQVARFVDKLRPRFDKVSFLLPYMAMSAGTIFVMSGDEIIMNSRAYIGPTDPQVPNKDGMYVPAQSILTLIDEIKERGADLLSKGQNPPWTDLQILRQIDAKEIGNAINASKYSEELVENYLHDFKFKSWDKHSNGSIVTPEDRRTRAKEIAKMLCNHSQWKTHSRGITREIAWSQCKIKTIRTEDVEGLDKAVRRFWALIYWIFENTSVFKIFTSDNYAIFRNDRSLINTK